MLIIEVLDELEILTKQNREYGKIPEKKGEYSPEKAPLGYCKFVLGLIAFAFNPFTCVFCDDNLHQTPCGSFRGMQFLVLQISLPLYDCVLFSI